MGWSLETVDAQCVVAHLVSKKRGIPTDLHFARIHAHLLIVTFFAPLENEVLVIYSKKDVIFFKKPLTDTTRSSSQELRTLNTQGTQIVSFVVSGLSCKKYEL